MADTQLRLSMLVVLAKLRLALFGREKRALTVRSYLPQTRGGLCWGGLRLIGAADCSGYSLGGSCQEP